VSLATVRHTPLLLLALGCGGEKAGPQPAPADSAAPPADSAEPPGGDPATVPLRGACALDQRWGGFSVEVGPDYSSVSGAVADGVVPISILTEVAVDGDCRLLRRENPRCEPACEPDEACGLDGACVPYPVNQDLGVVSLVGLSADLALEPVPPGTTYFNTTLPHPGVAADAWVQLTAPGGALGPLTLHGVGPEPLTGATLSWSIGDRPLDLTWTPPEGLGRARVQIRLMIDQHGNSPASLVCDTDDDGAATVPQAVIAELLRAGVSGFPSGTITRATVDSAPLAPGGCAELRLQTALLAEVTVDDHVPCDSHDDCPEGTLCNFALETCQ
jgi:hypothetical protein